MVNARNTQNHSGNANCEVLPKFVFFFFYLSQAETTKYLKEMWTSLKRSSQTSLQELGSIQRYLSVDLSKSESEKRNHVFLPKTCLFSRTIIILKLELVLSEGFVSYCYRNLSTTESCMHWMHCLHLKEALLLTPSYMTCTPIHINDCSLLWPLLPDECRHLLTPGVCCRNTNKHICYFKWCQ